MTEQTKELTILDLYANEHHMARDDLVVVLMRMVSPKDKTGKDLATKADILGFLQVARRLDLDPWSREIYLIVSKGVVRPYISVDGYSAIINRQPNFDGMEFAYEQDGDGRFLSVTCTMWRKDRSRPTVVTEFLSECFRDTDAWRGSPSRMLRHRAMIQCARLAFGISAAFSEESDDHPVAPAPEPARPPAPTARRTPPSPPRGNDAGKAETPASGQKNAPFEDVDPETGEVNERPNPQDFLDELNDALVTAKTLKELETIWSDHDVHVVFKDLPQWYVKAEDIVHLHQDRIEKVKS